jgi:hypothetical protein
MRRDNQHEKSPERNPIKGKNGNIVYAIQDKEFQNEV